MGRILYVAAQAALVSLMLYFSIHLFQGEGDRINDVSLRTPSADRQYPITVKSLRLYVSLSDYIEDTFGPVIFLAPPRPRGRPSPLLRAALSVRHSKRSGVTRANVCFPPIADVAATIGGARHRC